jgi:cell division protein FtsB
MQLAEDISSLNYVSLRQVGVVPKVTINSDAPETTLWEMRIDNLRKAIRKNEVSFPSQVPTFPKHDRPDVQQKLAQLYFVLGWSGPKIGARYGLSRLRVHQILGTWTRRAVEAGFIQGVPPAESVEQPFKQPPIQVVLSPVASGPAAHTIQSSGPCETSPPPSDQNEIPDQADSRKGFRPRRKIEAEQIVGVLKELEAGRAVTEMADEVGVSTSTIRTWRRQSEIRLLRRENTQLKEQIEKLNAGEATLISPITISDGLERAAFMPCLRFVAHTEFDYHESLVIHP